MSDIKAKIRIAVMVEKWRTFAVESIDDIGGWRAHAGDRPELAADPLRGWHPWSHRYWVWTSGLVSLITSDYPKLDPQPLLDVYAHVCTWYSARSADGLPNQQALIVLLERAVITVNAIQSHVLPEHVKPIRMDQTAREIEAFIRQNPGKSAKDIAKKLDLTYQNVRRVISKKLKPKGFVNKGGYYPPSASPV